ncbi:MAG: class I SAM-dependent methyltransferase [Bacteroidia bacterium]
MESYLTECTLCSSTSFTLLTGYENAGLVRCNSCRTVFTRIIPTEERLIWIYKNYPRVPAVSETTKKRYHEILDKLESFRKTNRLIDVGCGEGFFLVEAKKRGWDVYGTEYSSVYIEDCSRKGIQMFQGELGNVPLEPGSFDVIVTIEVFEHLRNPLNETILFNKMLRDGGALYLTTPNFNALSRYILKKNWSIICFPDHLFYFTPKSLNHLLQRNGFKKKYLITEGISVERIRQYLRKRKGNAPAKIPGQVSLDLVWQAEIEKRTGLRILKKIVNTILKVTGTGDGMKSLFVKNNTNSGKK